LLTIGCLRIKYRHSFLRIPTQLMSCTDQASLVELLGLLLTSINWLQSFGKMHIIIDFNHRYRRQYNMSLGFWLWNEIILIGLTLWPEQSQLTIRYRIRSPHRYGYGVSRRLVLEYVDNIRITSLLLERDCQIKKITRVHLYVYNNRCRIKNN